MHRSSSTSPWPQSSLPPSSASHWWKETKRVKFGACTEHEQPSIPIDATSVTTPVDMLPVAPVCEQMLQATSAGTSGILKESARIQEPSYVQALRDVLSWRNLSTFLSLDSRWQAIYGILFSLDPYPQGGLQNIRMAYEYIFRGSRLDINVDILRYCVLELGIQDLDELQKFATYYPALKLKYSPILHTRSAYSCETYIEACSYDFKMTFRWHTETCCTMT